MNYTNINTEALDLQNARRGRSSSSLFSSWVTSLTGKVLIVAAVFHGVIGQSSTLVEPASEITLREVASLRFPQISTERDEEDMIVRYMPYLQFVTSIGSEVDGQTTKRLVHVYQNLRRRSKSGAALFLKGLRYEMNQKVDLSGLNPHALSSNSPEMRQFVARYLTTWLREADEHLFRSYSNQIASRRAE